MPFDISWRSVEARGVPFGEGYLSDQGSRPHLVRWGDGAVVAYTTLAEDGPQMGPMIWRSVDLVEWHRVASPGPGGQPIEVEKLLVGGPGLVALARDQYGQPTSLLVSVDGERWESITDLPPLAFVWARPGVIVGYGQEETWVSPDGRSWSLAGSSPLAGNDYWLPRMSFVDVGETALAFVRSSEQATGVHRLWTDGRWEHLAELPGEVNQMVVGPNGIVVLGSRLAGAEDAGHTPAAWRSPDGVTWTTGAGPTDPQTLVLTRAGYVATSQLIYMSGCDGLPLGAQIAQTWTSHDGLTWRQMPEQRLLDHTVLSFLLADAERVLALGVRWASAGEGEPSFEPVTFEAALPQPEPSHTPLPVPKGCGEE